VILCEGGLVTAERLPITVAPATPTVATGVVTSVPSEALKLSVAERDSSEKAVSTA